MKESFGVIGIGKRGKSGLEAAKVLKALGEDVFLSEVGSIDIYSEEARLLEEWGIPFELGGHSEEVFKKDVLIVCPGIKPDAPVLLEARKRKIEIWSEIELAYRIAQAPIIAVTGTNGKTTTSSLVAHLAKETGKRVFLGGNIGVPLVKISLEASPSSLIVSEISSNQLEYIHRFRPWIAILLNFSEDHLDRYGTLENYRRAKSRITMNQMEGDWVVRNLDDQWSSETPSRAQSIFFSSRILPSFGSFLQEDKVLLKDQEEVPVCQVSSLPLVLRANPENALAAAACGMILGIPPERISRSLKTFPGVPHRLEEVCQIDGVLYLNDSSGTNPLSTLRALSAIDRPVILIAGGSEKQSDFSPLILGFKCKVKHLVLFGATKERIAETCRKHGFFSFTVEENDLQKVIKRARSLAEPGDVVLFSPACASFDMFKDFEHRGEVFREMVLEEEKCG
ncbi:MAG: UDP-N-acetylmuramoyl-L-alanine--D-glutamate ligase [Caldisericota bacterium]|nr:UDP-N-acetylmuramoyl-L-alanine--D-glutamate ligase [Caldisericota bacterium]